MKTIIFIMLSMYSYGQRDSVIIERVRIYEIVNTIEDLIEWNKEDEFNGKEPRPIQNYWLTAMRDELIEKLNK
tara:strand:- start:1125 stop:1343 length:219 start_codon:yes stop_codon:yes gene_type:complete